MKANQPYDVHRYLVRRSVIVATSAVLLPFRFHDVIWFALLSLAALWLPMQARNWVPRELIRVKTRPAFNFRGLIFSDTFIALLLVAMRLSGSQNRLAFRTVSFELWLIGFAPLLGLSFFNVSKEDQKFWRMLLKGYVWVTIFVPLFMTLLHGVILKAV